MRAALIAQDVSIHVAATPSSYLQTHKGINTMTHLLGGQSPLTPYGAQQAAQSMPQVAPTPTMLDTILHQLTGMHIQAERVEMAVYRATGLAVEGRDGASPPASDALLDRIHIAVNALRNRLEAVADRLERVA